MVAAVNHQYEIARILLESGAEPNLGDEFITAKRTAKEKGLHPIDGNLILFLIVTVCVPKVLPSLLVQTKGFKDNFNTVKSR